MIESATQALFDWIDNGCKPHSSVAFTDGELRRTAWFIEYALSKKEEQKLQENKKICKTYRIYSPSIKKG